MQGVASDLLRIYLQDHHAGAVVGLELAKRAADSNSDWAHGAEIAELRDQIAADKEALETIMDHLDAGPSKIKDGLGWTAEKLGRLKPNDHLFSQSPLSRRDRARGAGDRRHRESSALGGTARRRGRQRRWRRHRRARRPRRLAALAGSRPCVAPLPSRRFVAADSPA